MFALEMLGIVFGLSLLLFLVAKRQEQKGSTNPITFECIAMGQFFSTVTALMLYVCLAMVLK